jgi:hypothetical protein
MRNLFKRMTVTLTICALIAIPCASSALAGMNSDPGNTDAAYAEDSMTYNRGMKAEKMVADALLVRPLGLVGTIFGTAIFLVSLPFSALGGNVEEAYQKMVVEPAHYTFGRPLGDL